jgi:hypothetical protein
MFCPKCGSEYVEGITECADCKVALKPEPPRQVHRTPREFIEVLQTYNAGDIALIRSLLDNDDIEYIFQGDTVNSIYPLLLPATLIVRKDQVERVRELVQHMQVTFLAMSA